LGTEDIVTSRILITGGGSGFGRALAEIYAGRGDRVLVTDLAPTAVVAKASVAGHGEVAYLQLDVRDDEAWRAARDWVVERWGGLDMLINNAGVATGGRIDVLPMAEWQRLVDIDLLGVVRGCQTFTPLFKQQRSGRIVNVASLAGLVHAPHMSAYNAVKAGVVALSETLLFELSPYSIGVSVVCPSFFRTNLHKSVPTTDPALAKTAKTLIAKSPRSANTVAKRTVRALDKERFMVRPHAEAVVVATAKHLATPLYHPTMKWLARRLDPTARQRDA
jgi:NAD(P)-dependent dehydrogenase (short-subunit alcohol dehydrogenase family)